MVPGLLDFEVAYNTDVNFACDLIKQTIVRAWDSDKWHDVILEEPEVWGVENLGADGVTIRVAVKTLPGQQFPVARHMRVQIKAAFEEAGVEIPFARGLRHDAAASPATSPPRSIVRRERQPYRNCLFSRRTGRPIHKSSSDAPRKAIRSLGRTTMDMCKTIQRVPRRGGHGGTDPDLAATAIVHSRLRCVRRAQSKERGSV